MASLPDWCRVLLGLMVHPHSWRGCARCPARDPFRNLWCGEASVGLPGPSAVLVQFRAWKGASRGLGRGPGDEAESPALSTGQQSCRGQSRAVGPGWVGPGGWWTGLSFGSPPRQRLIPARSSTVAVHPVTQPRVWPATPQEDTRPELLTESPPKCYPVQEPAQQLLNTPPVQSQQKSCPHVRHLPQVFVCFGPVPWRPPVLHCPPQALEPCTLACRLTAGGLARCHRRPHLPAVPGSRPAPQTAFSSGALGSAWPSSSVGPAQSPPSLPTPEPACGHTSACCDTER